MQGKFTEKEINILQRLNNYSLNIMVHIIMIIKDLTTLVNYLNLKIHLNMELTLLNILLITQ